MKICDDILFITLSIPINLIMDTIIIILFFALLGVVITLLVFDIIQFCKLNKYVKEGGDLKSKDAQYYELKFRIQLIISLASIILVIFGFFGFNSISNLRDEFSEKLEHYITNLERSDSLNVVYQNRIAELDSLNIQAVRAYNTSKGDANRLIGELGRLASKYTVEIETFMIKDIEIDPENRDPVRIYYSNLETTQGLSLPKFSSPPILNVIDYGFNELSIIRPLGNR